MTNQGSLKEDSIQETMLGPLWARATCSQQYIGILEDLKAEEILKNINYDFSAIKKLLGGWRGIGLLVRARSLDEAIKDYLNTHPSATVINIAAGLDTTFYRVDNGKIMWYDLDLPDAIEYRRKYIPETPRCKCIASSAFDYEWMDETDYDMKRGIFFTAGGFFYYFTEEKVIEFFRNLAERFPGGEIAFDCVSNIAIKILNKRAEKANSDIRLYLGIGNPEKTISKWSDKFEVVDWYTMYGRTQLDSNWSKETLKRIKMSERLKIAKIVRVKFLD